MSDIFGLRPENKGDTATASKATATAFNPFDALGVVAAPMDQGQITAAWRRAHQHLKQATATGATPVFPTAANINAARDYLRDATATAVRTSAALWRNEARTFFAELDLGDANVFSTPGATATASGAGARARRSPPPETPHKKARTTATPGSSRDNAWNVEEEEKEDDDDGDASYTTAAATPGSASSGSAPSSARKPVNRSSGLSARATAAANPNTELEIVVGEWSKSTATAARNAVIARLDSRGRLNFRIVARTVAGDATPGPTATATGYANIDLMGQYQGMTYQELRVELLRALSNPQQLGN